MMGRKNCRVHRNVFRKAGKQRNRTASIATGVLGVAPDYQPPTAKPQIEVTKSRCALSAEGTPTGRRRLPCRFRVLPRVHRHQCVRHGRSARGAPRPPAAAGALPDAARSGRDTALVTAWRKMKRQPCVASGSADAPVTSASDMRSPDESHPWRDQWPFVASITIRWRSKTSSAGAANGPLDVPAPGAGGDPAPRRAAAATRSGWQLCQPRRWW